MDIAEERRGGIVILSPTGRVDSGTAPAFEAALLRAVAGESASSGAASSGAVPQGPVRLVVDLGRVSHFSSAGLRALLVVTRTKPAGSRVLLAAVPATARALFTGSGFAALFEIHPALEDALAALG